MTLQANETQKEQPVRSSSLRARLALATTLTAVLATLIIGYFAFVRNEATQSFLGSRFQQAVEEKAESQIEALVSHEAQQIDDFFRQIDNHVASTATYAASLLSEDTAFTNPSYWDATQKLYRLSGGGWDNPNGDAAAIFAPASFQLDERTIAIANALSHLDFFVPSLVDGNENILAIYFGNFDGYTYYYPNIDLATLVPPDFDPAQRPWFIQARDSSYTQPAVIWSNPYNDAAQNGFVVTSSVPIVDDSGNFYGVIGADVKLDTITSRVLNIRIGSTGYAFLADGEGNIITMPDYGYANFGIERQPTPNGEDPELASLQDGLEELQPDFEKIVAGHTGLDRVFLQGKEHYLVYAPITAAGYSLGVVVPVEEMDAAYREAQTLVREENQRTQTFGLLLLIAVVIAATAISYFVSQLVTNPLEQLATTAKQVSAGDLTAQAPETSVREVNVLSRTFNTMTSRLRNILAELEERVQERTNALERANTQNQRRAMQFEAIALVAREISASQDLETLLPKITTVISQQFGYYHVGVFLLDASKEYAVLRAANSRGGQKMLAREHSLKVGQTSIVGFVASRGKARIALDTGLDAVYFDNPDLPETRSEMALPMSVGSDIIGALDVQSREPNAFSPEDIETLSTLADQVSIAIHNAQLYEEMRKALAQSQTLMQQVTSDRWSQFKRTQNLAGIRRSKTKSTLLQEPLSVNETDEADFMQLPIKLRNQKIGELKIRSANERAWTQDEIDIAAAIIERAAIAMENARLLTDAQRRASRERVIGEIASTIGASTDMETILRNTVQELGRRMGGAEVILELGIENDANAAETADD